MLFDQRYWISLAEIIAFTLDTFGRYKARFFLTTLTMVIGTASLIVVVSIGLTGKQYVLSQIDAIGVNWIFAEYAGGAQGSSGPPDPLTLDDLKAVTREVPGIVAASPVMPLQFRVRAEGGKQSNIQMLGVNPDYQRVRNLVLVAGRFLDDDDLRARNKVAVLTEQMAETLYSEGDLATGHVITVADLPFTVIGTFKERVETFGRSEVTANTMLVPVTVSRFFVDDDSVKQLYFSVSSSDLVVPATDAIKVIIQKRHRAGSMYNVDNLTELIRVAKNTANALTLVLLMLSGITLLVSGVGIMNIMLATVNARTREIGIRKAVGATNQSILFQFLAESFLISAVGGFTGTFLGLGVPVGVRFLTDYHVDISGLSAIVGFVFSSLIGILFGVVPATRAARLSPVTSLRSE